MTPVKSLRITDNVRRLELTVTARHDEIAYWIVRTWRNVDHRNPDVEDGIALALDQLKVHPDLSKKSDDARVGWMVRTARCRIIDLWKVRNPHGGNMSFDADFVPERATTGAIDELEDFAAIAEPVQMGDEDDEAPDERPKFDRLDGFLSLSKWGQSVAVGRRVIL